MNKKRLSLVAAVAVVSALAVVSFFLMGSSTPEYETNKTAIAETITGAELVTLQIDHYPTETGVMKDSSAEEREAFLNDAMAKIETYYTDPLISTFRNTCEGIFQYDGDYITYTADAGVNECDIIDLSFNDDYTEATATAQVTSWVKFIDSAEDGVEVNPIIDKWQTTYSLKKVDGQWKVYQTRDMFVVEEGEQATAAAANAMSDAETADLHFSTFAEALEAAAEIDLTEIDL